MLDGTPTWGRASPNDTQHYFELYSSMNVVFNDDYMSLFCQYSAALTNPTHTTFNYLFDGTRLIPKVVLALVEQDNKPLIIALHQATRYNRSAIVTPYDGRAFVFWGDVQHGYMCLDGAFKIDKKSKSVSLFD